MFIYHFNRMIRNKLLWLIIAVITVFAFVFAGYVGGGGSRTSSAGNLKGRQIDARELARQEMFVRGPGRNRSNLPYVVVQSQAWERVAALDAAREMGIVTGADEIRAAIREMPDFKDSAGNFSRQQYQYVMRELDGWTPALFEQYIGEQVTLSKLQALIGSASWVSPLEMQGEYGSWTDMLTVRTATITNLVDAAAIEISEDDLRAFYDTEPTRYDLPDQVQVRYIEQSVTNFLPFVTITDDDIANYYDENTGDFTRMSTNNVRESIPLEEVSEKIRGILAMDDARYMASTNAMKDFLVYVRDKSEGIFDKFAANGGMNISTTALFNADSFIPGIDGGALREFRETSFDLDPERDDSRCGIAVGGSHIYLISAIANIPAHTPAFEDVRGLVESDARADARKKAFDEQLEAQVAQVKAALAEGKDFGEAVAVAGTSAGEPLNFSLFTMPRASFDPSGEAALQLRTLAAGEMTEPVNTYLGALLVYVDAREPKATPTDADGISEYTMLRNQFRSMLGRTRQMAQFGDWMEGNLEGTGFAPVAPIEDIDYDDEQ